MEDKKFKRIVICILVAVGVIFGFLALLNGRYIADNHREHHAMFDQWKGEYVLIQNHNR